MNSRVKKMVAATALSLALVTVGAPQIQQLIKIVGVGAAVKQFGPEINRALNRLSKHQDSNAVTTKVVPIISISVGGGRKGIGAAQVMGPRSQVEKVSAVAQLDQDLFGKEIKVRAMVPVESEKFTDIQRVEGVGVSGIVDLKL